MFAREDTLFDLALWTTLQVVSPLGTTSSSGQWRTLTRPFSSFEQHSTLARKETLIGQHHWATLHATSVIGSHDRSSYRIRRSCSASTLNSQMCLNLHLPVIFLPLEHGPVWPRIYSIPLCFSHMKRLFDYLFDIWPLCRHYLDILSSSKLTSSLAVDAFSACLRKSSPAHAVELLEQGRGVFWSQLLRLHSPLYDLIESSPAGKKLADQLTRLALLIRNALEVPSADQHERMCRLNLKMHGVVTNVRKLHGLSRFLLPSLFSELQRAASGGPVVIVNASKYSCDALVVLLDQDPVHIPLRITQEGVRKLSKEIRTLAMRAARFDVTRELAFFLRKLWDQIISPIVDFLHTILPSQSRIWWCPTDEFSVLLLHAGPYRKGQHNLPDLYISSYIPTLTALIRARRRHPSDVVTQEKRFVAIGQAKASGESKLLSVGTELDNIRQCVDGLATFTRIDGEESCTSRVVEELGKNEWVHLACHGLPNQNQPFESAFALSDGHFTIQHIIGCDLQNPEFAYLSACHTTVGDEESPDEAIHLASAMQFVGFRSVIGTMWAWTMVRRTGSRRISIWWTSLVVWIILVPRSR